MPHGLELALLVLGTAFAGGAAARAVGLPTLLGYLLAGLALGSAGAGSHAEAGQLAQVSELGVVLLLFSIGTEFSIERIRRAGFRMAGAGLLQVGFTAVGGVLFAASLGRGFGEGLAIALALALSSTAVVLKLLAERRESDAPHGRLAIGILIVQDLLVIPILLLLPILAGVGDQTPLGDRSGGVGTILFRAALFLVLVASLGRWILPNLLERIVRVGSRDLLVLAGLVLCLGGAGGSAAAGLSPGLGAFVAGVLLAGSRYGLHLAADLAPLREAAVAVFFVSLGMTIDLGVILARPGAACAMLLFFMSGKILATGLAAVSARYPPRVAFETGLVLAQGGEFSFLVLASAESLGLLGAQARSVAAVAIFVSLLAAVPMTALAGGIRRRGGAGARPAEPEEEDPLVLVVGMGPSGRAVARGLREEGLRVAGIDLNPENLARAEKDGVETHFGDAIRPEVLSAAGLFSAEMVVLTLPDPVAIETLLDRLRVVRPGLPIIVRARFASEVAPYLARGAAAVAAEEREVAKGLLDSIREVRAGS